MYMYNYILNQSDSHFFTMLLCVCKRESLDQNYSEAESNEL